ncbi:hypothetical protein HanRHA438_Chr03g0123441 [Helianthus annuus]|nr:hypothetical protein HanRHA438_Chr03g0123441 [Helianthus annuus]
MFKIVNILIINPKSTQGDINLYANIRRREEPAFDFETKKYISKSGGTSEGRHIRQNIKRLGERRTNSVEQHQTHKVLHRTKRQKKRRSREKKVIGSRVQAAIKIHVRVCNLLVLNF